MYVPCCLLRQQSEVIVVIKYRLNQEQLYRGMEFEKHGKTSEQAIYPELGESEGKSFKSNMNPHPSVCFILIF
jgi:hypothetical protein